MSFDPANGSGTLAPPAPPQYTPAPPQQAPPINPSVGAPPLPGPTHAVYPASPTPVPIIPQAPAPPQYQPAPQFTQQQAPPPQYQPPAYQAPAPPSYQPAQPTPTPSVTPAPAGQYTAEQVAQLLAQQAAAYQPAPAPAPAAAPVQRGQWDDLEYDASWKANARYDDDTDRYVPVNPADLTSIGAASKMNEAHAIRRERLEKLTTKNPADIAWEAGLERRVRDEVRAEYQAMRNEEVANAKMARWLNDRKGAIYELDPQGQVQYHQPQYIDGQWVTNARMSGYGQTVAQKLQEFSQAGLTDPDLVMEYLEALQPPNPNPPQPIQPQPQYQPPAPQYNPPAPSFGAPPASAQELFIRRAELSQGQPAASANGTLVRDAIQPTPHPVSLLDNNDYFTRTAYATGFLQPPMNRR